MSCSQVGLNIDTPNSAWAPIGTGLDNTNCRDSSLGPMGSNLLTKGVKAFDTSSGLLPNPTSQAQTQRKHLSSIKSKKALARSLSQLSQPNTDRTSLEKLLSASSSFLPPFHASSPNRVPVPSFNPAFKFSASPCGEVNHPSGQSEPLFSGDQRAIPSLTETKVINSSGKVGESLNLKTNPDEHCQSTTVGNGDVIVGEQSSPRSREGSIYEDMGFDGMVSKEGDGAPPYV